MNDNDNALDPVPNTPPVTTTNFDFSNFDPITISDPNKILVAQEEANSPVDVEHSQESTRAQIAVLFTQFFLFIIALAFLGPFVVSLLNPELVPNPLDVSKNMVTEIASVLAGPFGFIVGFYFKQGNSK